MSGTKVALAQPHSFQSGALSFISCTSARESSPLDENDSLQPTEFKAETKKKRFHPLRNLRRMFRRKSRRSSTSVDSYPVGVPDNSEIPAANLEHRSCSTSRLQEENVTHSLMKNNRLNPGLSLSHDSIFTPDRTDSGLSSSDLENSSLSITVLTPPSREFTIKSQSSCSETSLLSLGSSEVELSPCKSGKLSDLDLGVATYKLSHSAAKHKMAVKPKRNHGAPRNRRKTLTSKSPLPTTVEVSEEGAVGQTFPLEFDSCSPSKSSWSQVPVEPILNDQVEKLSEVFKEDEEVDGKEEESSSQKQESFFGRFLYRRSEKKKKGVREPNHEEILEDKCSQSQKKVSRSSAKTPNQRQRVEPVEIPVSPIMGTNAFRGQRDGKGVISSSVSPPKNNWPSQVLSRSTSPPKVIWPENFPSEIKSKEEIWEQRKTPELPPTKNIPTDLKNPEFMKELMDSVILFGKDENGKRKKDEEDENIVLKIRRQHSENEIPRKTKNFSENSLPEPSKSDPIEENPPEGEDVAKDKDEPPKVKCRSPYDYHSTQNGYENIQIIEQVKKEMQKKLTDEPMEVEKKLESKVIVEKPIITDFIRKEPEKSVTEKILEEEEMIKSESEKMTTDVSFERAEPEVIRRVKPLISEKPKDLRKGGGFESNKIENSSKMEIKPAITDEVKVVPRARSTLIERRKSELFLLTEAEEKNWKTKTNPVKKQASFKETTSDRLSFHESSIESKNEFPKKTEPSSTEPTMEEVIFRKKPIVNQSDEQPELMKVFARRSLKVKESEKLAEELQKSRDSASDKENEIVDSVEERKNSSTSDEKKEAGGEKEESRMLNKGKPPGEVKVNITPLKPEVMSRKGVLHRYGRSLSEINAKKEGTDSNSYAPEESKTRSLSETTKNEEKEEKKEEEEKEEAGFKRIQQRKAEWERRAQQSAK